MGGRSSSESRVSTPLGRELWSHRRPALTRNEGGGCLLKAADVDLEQGALGAMPVKALPLASHGLPQVGRKHSARALRPVAGLRTVLYSLY